MREDRWLRRRYSAVQGLMTEDVGGVLCNVDLFPDLRIRYRHPGTKTATVEIPRVTTCRPGELKRHTQRDLTQKQFYTYLRGGNVFCRLARWRDCWDGRRLRHDRC